MTTNVDEIILKVREDHIIIKISDIPTRKWDSAIIASPQIGEANMDSIIKGGCLW